MRFTYLVLIAGLTFACGKIDKQEITSTPIPGSNNGDPEVPPVPAALAVTDAAQLPTCTAAIEGQLVYARKEAVFATCASGNWVKIDIGAVASSGASGIQTSVYCSMTLSAEDLATAGGLDNVPLGGINFDYSITQFSNKTRYVQGRISSAAFSHASGIFWTDKQGGYNAANSDSFVFDVHGIQDFGFFYFTADKAITADEKNPYAVVYADPTIEGGKVLIFDSQKDCIVNVY